MLFRLLLLVSLLCPYLVKAQEGLFYEVTGKGLAKPSYLFGTLHMVCTEKYQLPIPVKAAAEKADVIYTEIELRNIQAQAGAVVKYMLAPTDSTVDKVLNKDDYARVGAWIKDSLGLGIEQAKRFKPFAVVTIGMQSMAPCSPVSAVEQLLLYAYPKKENLGLETIDFQMNLLMNQPIASQAKYLVDSEKQWVKYKATLKQLMDAYTKADVVQIQKLLAENEDSDMMNPEAFITSRNNNWLAKMPEIMQKKSCVFAVGAAHLWGEKGLVTQLRKMGYSVKSL